MPPARHLVILILLCCFVHQGLPFQFGWWPALSYALVQWDRFKDTQVDFSAGAGSLSSPEKLTYVPKLMFNTSAESDGSGGNGGSLASPLLLAHQMGKRMVKKLPDSALLGVLVLIASELLQREVNTQFLTLPPVLRALANNTALELDSKLEFLSSLQWDVDPFLRAEIEQLNKQPLEVIDKFIVTEILPRVDNQLSPVLSNLIGDPNSVTQITRNIKDLIQVISVVITSDTQKKPQTLTDTVMKQVDIVGETVEEGERVKSRTLVTFRLPQLNLYTHIPTYTQPSRTGIVSSLTWARLSRRRASWTSYRPFSATTTLISGALAST